MFTIGRTVAVDDYSEISFSILQETLPSQLILLVVSTELIFLTQLVSGAAGRANVWLYPASS